MNKRLIILFAISLGAIIALLMYLLFSGGKLLDGPESIAYDTVGKRFFVSNTLGKSIVTMRMDGRYKAYLKEGLTAPRGIYIQGNNLFVADVTQLKMIDIPSAKIIDSISISGAKLLNDLAIDRKGLVYITDMTENCVFIYDPDSKTTAKVVNTLLKSPNGIIYDMPRNQMLIVGFAEQSPILSLSTVDRSVKVFMDSIYSDLDGIAIDDLGRIYISSWAQNMIFMVPQEQNRFIAKFKGISDAADIYYHLPTNELIVPLFSSNKIIRLELE